MPKLRKATVEEAARFFGRKVRTIQHWAEKEGMPRTARGEYDLVKCSRWLIKRLRAELAKSKQGDQTLYRLKKEEQEMKNLERTIKLKKLGGEYLEYIQVKNAWVIVMKVIMKFLDTLPVRMKNKYSLSAEVFLQVREAVKELRVDISRLSPEDYLKELDEYEAKVNQEEEKELL